MYLGMDNLAAHLLPQSPPAETDHHSLGSVEKLREALQTPSTSSREDIFGNRFGLRTPALFGKLSNAIFGLKQIVNTSYMLRYAVYLIITHIFVFG